MAREALSITVPSNRDLKGQRFLTAEKAASQSERTAVRERSVRESSSASVFVPPTRQALKMRHPSAKDAREPRFAGDFELAQALMRGDATAAEVLMKKTKVVVEGNLLRSCHDRGSMDKAREIVADVLGECFSPVNFATGGRSILALYDGRTSLTGWLIRVARSRLVTWWNQGARNEPQDHSHLDTLPAEPQLVIDGEVVAALKRALERAFTQVRPQALVFLRLVFLHGIKRETIAAVWGYHPASIGRQVQVAMARVRQETLRELRNAHPDLQLTWDDCVATCLLCPQVLSGDALRAGPQPVTERMHSRSASAPAAPLNAASLSPLNRFST